MGYCPCFGVSFASGWRQVVVRFEDGEILPMSPRNLAREPEIAGSSRRQKITEASDSSGKSNTGGTGSFLFLSCPRKIFDCVVVRTSDEGPLCLLATAGAHSRSKASPTANATPPPQFEGSKDFTHASTPARFGSNDRRSSDDCPSPPCEHDHAHNLTPWPATNR